MMKCENKKKMNQKGFTLIELLAVISILAILMLLATGSVVTMLTNSKKNAFSIDAQKVIEQAKMNYIEASFNGTNVGEHFCMSMTYLKANGLEKANKNFEGSVEVKVTNNTATYKIWLTDGTQRFVGVEATALNKDIVEASADSVSTTCEGSGTPIK